MFHAHSLSQLLIPFSLKRELMMSTRKLTSKQEETICSRYTSGESSPTLALEYGVAPISIRRILKRSGIKLRTPRDSHRTKSLNHQAFDKLSPEACYWIGFLMADGNVSYLSENSAYISLVLNNKDRDHLEKFQSFLNSNHAIIEIKKQNTLRVSVSSIELARALSYYGVVPNKSRTASIKTLQVERNFWRGVIDGDGSLGFSKGKPILQLVGSLALVTQFENFVKALGTKTNASVRPHKSIYAFRLSGTAAQFVIGVLYKDARTFLNRKRKIATDILNAQIKTAAHLTKGEDHPKHKLTVVQVKEIREAYSQQRTTQEKLARKYNVSRTCIRSVLSFANWKNVATI